MSDEKITTIDIELLVPNPYQPRKVFNEKTIDELALSIKEYGILNPLLVRKKNEKYEIIAGERRYRAAKKVGLKEAPVIIKDISDEKTAEITLIENIQREELSPLEEAKSYQEIIDLTKITQTELANKIGKSQSAIANKMRLLSLPDEVQQALTNKKISERHARTLITINNKEYQIELLNKIINSKLTVKELEKIIQEENNKKEEKESDNMNNGNFFPNYNNQVNQPIPTNDQTSLNTLNMQSMGATPEVPVNETVLPTMPQPAIQGDPNLAQLTEQPPVSPLPTEIPPVPQVDVTSNELPPSQPNLNTPDGTIAPPIDNLNNLTAPQEEFQPLFNTEINNPIPSFNIVDENNNQVPNQQPENLQVASPSIDVPLQPEMNPINDIVPQPEASNPMQPLEVPIIEETPLFAINQTPPTEVVPQAEAIQPATVSIEIPQVTTTPLPQEQDNITKTEEFLKQNNIPYKLYSNETGKCIIIEM